MKLIYNNVDIYKDISLHGAVYETHCEKEADTLTLSFNDATGRWSKWNPQTNDTVQLQEGTLDTGIMYVFSVGFENGHCIIKAMSMPLSSKSKTTKSWDAVNFTTLCKEIASRHGLTYEGYGVQEQTYNYIAQDDEQDFSFLNGLCVLEGCQMLVYNNKLIVYSESYMENQEVKGDIEVCKNGDFYYTDIKQNCYGKCIIASGLITGSAIDSNGNASKVLTPHIKIPVNSTGEAIRYATNLLKDYNKNALNGVFIRSLKTDWSACSVLNLKTEKASGFDGKVFLTDVTHDIVKNKTIFRFRKLI